MKQVERAAVYVDTAALVESAVVCVVRRAFRHANPAKQHGGALCLSHWGLLSLGLSPARTAETNDD